MDFDCVDDVWVPSAICTSAKSGLCDDAYSATSDSPNNRAKCCPATSGCVKTAIGVVQTSTCSNTCGVPCLLDNDNPGNLDGRSPIVFCYFGSRVENMPYCPIMADQAQRTYSCNFGSQNADGDNSMCCNDTGDYTGTTVVPGFTCMGQGNPNTFGVPDCPICVDFDSVTGTASGDVLPCNATDYSCNSTVTIPADRDLLSEVPTSSPSDVPVPV